MQIQGFASLFDVLDSGDDIVNKGAFLDTLSTRDRFPMLFNHDPARVAGRWDKVEERVKGLWVEGEILDPELEELIRQKALFGLSMGYRAERYLREGHVRNLLAVALVEVSVVAVPMCYGCHIEIV